MYLLLFKQARTKIKTPPLNSVSTYPAIYMISVIVCSRTTLSEVFTNNITNSIGLPHEIIAIDNSDNRHNIFSAYNYGVSLSKYAITCFMHDDIVIQTQDWGKQVIECFKNKAIGLVGVLGTQSLSKTPSAWWSNDKSVVAYAIHALDGNTVLVNKNPSESTQHSIVVADGCWFCIRKECFQKIKFDTTFSGYHFYDIDICLQLFFAGYQLITTNEILIEHHSEGRHNFNWFKEMIKCYQKWRKLLPVQAIKINKKDQLIAEKKATKALLEIIKLENYYRKALQHLLKNGYYLLTFKLIWGQKMNSKHL